MRPRPHRTPAGFGLRFSPLTHEERIRVYCVLIKLVNCPALPVCTSRRAGSRQPSALRGLDPCADTATDRAFGRNNSRKHGQGRPFLRAARSGVFVLSNAITKSENRARQSTKAWPGFGFGFGVGFGVNERRSVCRRRRHLFCVGVAFLHDIMIS
jgi:hypothetical protein